MYWLSVFIYTSSFSCLIVTGNTGKFVFCASMKGIKMWGKLTLCLRLIIRFITFKKIYHFTSNILNAGYKRFLANITYVTYQKEPVYHFLLLKFNCLFKVLLQKILHAKFYWWCAYIILFSYAWPQKPIGPLCISMWGIADSILYTTHQLPGIISYSEGLQFAVRDLVQ